MPAADAERLAREVDGPVELMMIEDGNHIATNRALSLALAKRGLDEGAVGLIVMAGHSRPKDGVASLAYVPAIPLRGAMP
ncbi:MAG: hypothetical protein WDN48_18290 [Pseudolabrys sp.]